VTSKCFGDLGGGGAGLAVRFRAASLNEPAPGDGDRPRPKGVMHRIHISDSITTYKRTRYTTLEHVNGLGRRTNLGLRSKRLTQIQQKHGLYPVASRNPLRSRSNVAAFTLVEIPLVVYLLAPQTTRSSMARAAQPDSVASPRRGCHRAGRGRLCPACPMARWARSRRCSSRKICCSIW